MRIWMKKIQKMMNNKKKMMKSIIVKMIAKKKKISLKGKIFQRQNLIKMSRKKIRKKNQMTKKMIMVMNQKKRRKVMMNMVQKMKKRMFSRNHQRKVVKTKRVRKRSQVHLQIMRNLLKFLKRISIMKKKRRNICQSLQAERDLEGELVRVQVRVIRDQSTSDFC